MIRRGVETDEQNLKNVFFPLNSRETQLCNGCMKKLSLADPCGHAACDLRPSRSVGRNFDSGHGIPYSTERNPPSPRFQILDYYAFQI
jgi:hypothetical protein